MRLRSCLLTALGAALVALIAQGTAVAVPVTMQFTGVVTSAPDSFNAAQFANPITTGMTFTGVYTFESTLPDTNPSATVGQYRYTTGPGFGLTTTINGMQFQTATNVAGLNRIEVIHADPFNADRYALENFRNLTHNGFNVVQRLFLLDSTKTANADASLPVTAPNLALFGSKFFTVAIEDLDENFNSFSGTITSFSVVTAVPEASAFLAVGSVGLLTGLWRFRRRA